MAAPVALIQGASRGLGLAFCKHILKNNQFASVIATCRNPDGADELRGLIGQHPARLTMLKLNVNQEDNIRGPSEKAKQHSGIIVNITAKVGSIGDNGIYHTHVSLKPFLWVFSI
uniref:Uncharacterized protein n=1 Tax=Oryzias sinensis TaxID=183150 RepID=A0A8C8DND2_9TELE